MCAALFVGFSYDRRFFVLVLILLVFFLLLLIVRISRRRIADKRPIDRPGGNVLGDVQGHVDELRALRELKRQSASPFVFASGRGGPFTPSGFAKLLTRMLRHACGNALANRASMPEPCRPILAMLDQFDHALCGVGPRPVQKHLGQGVAKFALCAIEVERSYPPRHRMPALTNLSR